jgi:hypothetical protein
VRECDFRCMLALTCLVCRVFHSQSHHGMYTDEISAFQGQVAADLEMTSQASGSTVDTSRLRLEGHLLISSTCGISCSGVFIMHVCIVTVIAT